MSAEIVPPRFNRSPAVLRIGCGLIGAALVFAGPGCRRDRTGDYRLIDHLESANVIASPLVAVEALFAPLSKDIASGEFAPVEVDGRKAWAVPTPYPAATDNIEIAPEEFDVRRDGDRLKRMDEAKPGDWSWGWVKGEAVRRFSIAGRPGSPSETLSLGAGETAEVKLLAPPGPALFEMTAGSLARVRISVNDRPDRELSAGPGGVVRFVETLPLGECVLRVKGSGAGASPRAGGTNSPVALRLSPLSIKTASDLLLIYPPADVPSFIGKFRLRFVPGPRDVIVPVLRRLDPGPVLSLNLPVAAPEAFRLDLLCRSEEGGERLVLRADGGPEAGFELETGSGVISLAGRPGSEAVRLDVTSFGPAGGGDPGGAVLEGVVVRDTLRTEALPLFRFRSFRSFDEGLGGNPLFVKLKLKVSRETCQAIFAPPESEYRFQIRVPEDGALDFGYGLTDEARNEENGGAEFEVLLEDAGPAKSLFRAALDPSHNEEDRHIFNKRISLKAFAGRSVALRLTTRAVGSPAVLLPAFWAEPVLVSRIPAGDGPPNIILISIDTLRADHLGCYGYARPTSPAVDKLAGDAALFLQAMSASPTTISTHMSLLTGLNPTRHQVVYHSRSLDSHITTLPEILRRNGYACTAITGGGALSSRFGFAEGFDYYGEAPGANENVDSAARVFRRAAAWLRRNEGRRFFLFLHTYQPHNPYISPEPWGQMFLRPEHPWRSLQLQAVIGNGSPNLFRSLPPLERENIVALYDGEIRYTDEAFLGPFVEELKALGLYENSLIVFTSDHGEEFFEHGSWEHVHTLYDELLHVPLIVKFPGGRYKGLRADGVAGTVDVMPTILEAAGLGAAARGLDGSSLRSLLDGRGKRDRLRTAYLPAEFADHMPRRTAVREGPFKLILTDPFPPAAYDYFIPPPPPTGPVELFDIGRDPLETRNLAAAEPNRVRSLARAIEDVLKTGADKGRARVILLDRELEERLRALGYIK